MKAKKKMIGLFGVAVLTLGVFAEPTISIQRVQQRYPWNGFVDIDYTVSGVDEPANYFIKFTITTNGVSTGFAASEFLSSATLLNASNGSYRVTWDWEYEQEKFFAKNVSLKAQLMFGAGGDKSQCPYPEYMVIDLSAGSGDDATYPVTNGIYACTRLEAPALFNSDQTYKTEKLALRRIKATTFTMGSPAGEPGREPGDAFNRETQHPVTLTKDYFIGIFELTQKQWKNVMGSVLGSQSVTGDAIALGYVQYQDARGSSDGSDASKLDAVADGLAGAVDANSFLGKLRARTGIDTFDLPTEAQWENAARAKTTTSTYFGDVALDDNATLGLYCWYSKNSGSKMHEVGTRRQNWFGLYDMYGNAYEWCRDRVTIAPDDDWGTDAVTDPLRKVADGGAVERGGSYLNASSRDRSALRGGSVGVAHKNKNFGIRLSRTLPGVVCAADAVCKAEAEVTGLAFDTRILDVRTIEHLSDVLPFAWNDDPAWPTDGTGAGNATVSVVPMTGTDATKPATWTVAGPERTFVNERGEGTNAWNRQYAKLYQATLTHRLGETEVAYFDLSTHEELPKDPVDVLKETFGENAEIMVDADGNPVVIMKKDINGSLAISNDLGSVTIDLNGWTIAGTNGVDGTATTPGTNGGSAITVAGASGAAAGDTAVSVTNDMTAATGRPASGSAAALIGGNGGDGNPAGKGSPAVVDETGAEVAVTDPECLVRKGADGASLLPSGWKPVGTNAWIYVEDGVGHILGEGSLTNLPSGFNLNSITNVIIESGITEIGARFFKKCRKMNSITLGDDVVSVGTNAFYLCVSLERITVGNAAAVDSLKGAVVYQTAIKPDGTLYPIPNVTAVGYEQFLEGKVDLSDQHWTSLGKVDPAKTMEEYPPYRFFRIVLGQE